jgi:phosphoglycerol transferase MdoB-like AlkP superfamily enzyme
MRKILILWAATIVFFWGWYFMSYYNTGPSFFFSRGFHDHMFNVYSNILQIPASEIPMKLAYVFVVDTLIVFGIAALRWYKHWLPQSWNFIKHKLGLSSSYASRDKINAVAGGRVHPAE